MTGKAVGRRLGTAGLFALPFTIPAGDALMPGPPATTGIVTALLLALVPLALAWPLVPRIVRSPSGGRAALLGAGVSAGSAIACGILLEVLVGTGDPNAPWGPGPILAVYVFGVMALLFTPVGALTGWGVWRWERRTREA